MGPVDLHAELLRARARGQRRLTARMPPVRSAQPHPRSGLGRCSRAKESVSGHGGADEGAQGSRRGARTPLRDLTPEIRELTVGPNNLLRTATSAEHSLTRYGFALHDLLMNLRA